MPGVAAVSRDIPSIAHINSPLAFCPKGTLLDHGKERTEPYTFLSFIWSFMGKDNGTEPAWYVRFNPVAWIVYYTRWAAIRDSFPSFTHFFPISTAMQRWLEKYGVAISKTTVLPNIVPVPATKEPKNKVLRLIYFGGYAPIKGLHILLDALKGVEESYELHCYGSGDNTQYQAQAKKNAITARFNGWTAEPDALKALEASDILVFPSLVPEGLGRVALVAMAAGKPVIASRIGGITDSIVDGKTGYLVEPGNVAAWRKAIRDLLSNKKRREAFGKAGRERFTAEFNKESILKKALAAYKTVSL
jgi:glycosyltransferase involved in cell wall biosynthesis